MMDRTTQTLMVLGVGLGAFYLWNRSQQPLVAAKPAGTITPSGSNTWDISLPPVQAFPVCPAGQYYDPALQMCMVAPQT